MNSPRRHLVWAVLAAALLACLPRAWGQTSAWPSSWDSSWTFYETDGVCHLKRPVPDYGVARFSARKWQPIAFELKAHRDFGHGPIRVKRHAPAWHPQAATAAAVLATLTHVPGAGATSGARSAGDLLLALRDGYDLKLVAAARFDAPETLLVHLFAQGLRPALEDFLACAKSDLSASFAELSRSRISYPTDGYEIDPAEVARLKALAAYVNADPRVRRIFIDGHTDASGSRRRNHTLSERRARGVAERFQSFGLRDVELIVRFHGAVYPVADNATVEGRALNRRTTIRLELGDPVELAQQGD